MQADFGYNLEDPGLTDAQRRRLAFPDTWLEDGGKQGAAAEAKRLRHGPDEWHLGLPPATPSAAGDFGARL